MTGHQNINMVEEIKNLIDYLDNEENKIDNFDIINNIEEDESINFSIDSEDINDENISLDKNEFYDEISYNNNFDFDLLDNDINFDDEDILNLSNSNSSILKENIKDSNQDFFNIENIKKDRGFLSLFTLNINNISQNLKNLLLFNKANSSLNSDDVFESDNNKNKNKKIKYPKKYIII